MPASEREGSARDGDRVLRHQHSMSSDCSRAMIPMWDSSDPERAPPPLPLNPQSPSVGKSRAGTSAAIQSAHAALTERARESALVSNALAKRIGDGSPERTPRGSPSHRRMQSMQPNSVRDLSLILESGIGRESNNSTPRSPDKLTRASTPMTAASSDYRSDDHDDQSSIVSSSTASGPVPGPSLTPIVRPIVRRPPQSIMGENTPPQSATMLALHHMASTASSARSAAPVHGPVPPPAHTEAKKPLSTLSNNSASIGGMRGNPPPPASTTSTVPNNNSSSSMTVAKLPTVAVDGLSNQILSLTNIATALQKELSLLSRRSRDNATDLMSLKEATNARDEDIRKSLREIISNSQDAIQATKTRDPYGGALLIDNKPHVHPTSPTSRSIRPFSIPRIPSPTSFAASLDRESMSTPSLVGSDGTATIALLEKTVRDMATKEGQDRLLGRLAEVMDRLAGMASANKVQELLDYVQEHQHQAVVPTNSYMTSRDLGNGPPMPQSRPRAVSFDDESQYSLDYSEVRSAGPSGPMTMRAERLLHHQPSQRRSSAPLARGGEAINDDILKIIKTVKDSVAQGGGLTAEVKALVRELRGEVLGMGREIGRRLDEVRANGEDRPESVTQAEIAKVIEEGLDELKQHMSDMMRDHRRQSAAEVATLASATAKAIPSAIDYDEVYNSVRAALKDSHSNKPASEEPRVSREDVIQAVKEAWEDYKPEIEVQQIGLERDEVLACLQEGLRQYAPKQEKQEMRAILPEQHTGVTRDEVYDAVAEGLRHFVPPQMPAAGISRDEVLGAVRECLEEFEFPVAPSAMGAELTKEDMLDAVKQGLSNFDFPQSPAKSVHSAVGDRELVHINTAASPHASYPDSLPTSLPAGLSAPFPSNNSRGLNSHSSLNDLNSAGGFGSLGDGSGGKDDIVLRLHQIMEYMKAEFKAVSDEAKQNVAANGRDTEQVLDATRDGLEKLREDLESYVDKVADAVTHEDFSEGLIRTLDVFRDEISDLVSRSSESSKEMLRDEIESLRDTVNTSLVPARPPPAPVANNREVLEALQEGVGLLRTEISNRHVAGTSEVLDALQEGLADLRITVEKLNNKPTDLTANDEILDALKSGLSDVRSEIDGLRDQSKAVATVATVENAMVPADDVLRRDDIHNLEGLISQLRTQVETIDDCQSKVSMSREIPAEPSMAQHHPTADPEWYEKLAQMESKLHDIHASVENMATREPTAAATPPPRPVGDAATREDVEAIETILRNTKSRLDELIDGEQGVQREHIDNLETLMLETQHALSDVQNKIDGIASRDDVNMIESLAAQVAHGFDEMKERHEKQQEDPERISKTDLDAIAMTCLEVKEAVEKMDKLADSPEGPAKEDMYALEVVVRELKAQLDSEAEVNAKAFEERQTEIAGVTERVGEVKTFLEELNEALKNKLEDGVQGIESIGKILDSLSESMDNNGNMGTDLSELLETMKAEFEDAKAGVVGAKLETDERLQQTTDTLEAVIEERIGDLMSKMDEIQMASEDRARTGESRDMEVEAAVVGTKVVADELKVLVDSLGTTVTDSLEKMEEASKTVFEQVEKMEEASRTVFEQVDGLMGQADEYHSDDKAEHQQTREQVQEAINLVLGLQGHVVEYQPQILETIKDVLMVVSEHYEHSKSSSSNLEEKIAEAKPPDQPLLPPIEKYDDTTVQEKLDQLVSQNDRAADAFTRLEKMDALVDHTLAVDGALSKLDRLVEQSEENDRALGHLSKLDSLDKLENLDKLDVLLSQAEATNHTLSELEKLSKLDTIVDLSHAASEAFENQHAKLDKLVGHSETANAALSRLDKLDKLDRLDEFLEQANPNSRALMDHPHEDTLDQVHQQVNKTAAELSQFMAAQTQRIQDDHEDREKTLQDTTIALERKQAEKEHAEASMAELKAEKQRMREQVEASISELMEEKQRLMEHSETSIAELKAEEQRLKDSVKALRSEQENLVRSKTRLSADVSSLETALHLRREELQLMESRAEGLERRILEGVMDHSRVLLMAKGNKGREAMSRKRVVPSKKGEAKGAGAKEAKDSNGSPDSVPITSSKPRAAFNMAMTAKRNPMPSNSPNSVGGSRRILSLSQINNNSPGGAINRSQSVRTSGAGGGLRKSSWGGRVTPKGYGSLERDKENAPLKESDEEDRDQHDASQRGAPGLEDHNALVPYGKGHDDCDDQSDAGTLRRSSLGTSVVSRLGGADDGIYSEPEDEDVMSQWTSSAVGSNTTEPSPTGDGSEMVLYGSEL